MTKSFCELLLSTSLLSEQDAIDCIEFFFKGPSLSKWLLDASKRGSSVRGRHEFVRDESLGGNLHKVSLMPRTIEKSFRENQVCGGNIKKPSSLKMAILMTLVHEIQHANQVYTHGVQRNSFYTGRYRRRPCELEARQFVDMNFDLIEEMSK